MKGVSYVGNDPSDIPDILIDSQSLHSVGGAMAWTSLKYNPTTISENITIPSNTNAMVAGPITIASGYTVTVSDTATLVIL